MLCLLYHNLKKILKKGTVLRVSKHHNHQIKEDYFLNNLRHLIILIIVEV